MKISRNLKIFTLLCVVVSFLSFYGLEEVITNYYQGRSSLMIVAGTIAALLVLTLALLKNEPQRERFTLSMLYHGVAVTVATIAWIWAYYALTVFQPIDLAWIIGVGLGSLALRVLIARNKLKGIDKRAAFK